jgi:hypothetical protein
MDPAFTPPPIAPVPEGAHRHSFPSLKIHGSGFGHHRRDGLNVCVGMTTACSRERAVFLLSRQRNFGGQGGDEAKNRLKQM